VTQELILVEKVLVQVPVSLAKNLLQKVYSAYLGLILSGKFNYPPYSGKQKKRLMHSAEKGCKAPVLGVFT
jgi:hypothetical protein